MATGNIFCNTGRAIATGLVTGVTSLLPKYIGIGSSTQASIVATIAALQTEYVTGTWSGYARVVATMSQMTTSVTNDTAKYSATFTAPAAETVSEAGNFDASSGGNIFIYGAFTGVALATNDTLTVNITWQLN